MALRLLVYLFLLQTIHPNQSPLLLFSIPFFLSYRCHRLIIFAFSTDLAYDSDCFLIWPNPFVTPVETGVLSEFVFDASVRLFKLCFHLSLYRSIALSIIFVYNLIIRIIHSFNHSSTDLLIHTHTHTHAQWVELPHWPRTRNRRLRDKINFSMQLVLCSRLVFHRPSYI